MFFSFFLVLWFLFFLLVLLLLLLLLLLRLFFCFVQNAAGLPEGCFNGCVRASSGAVRGSPFFFQLLKLKPERVQIIEIINPLLAGTKFKPGLPSWVRTG